MMRRVAILLALVALAAGGASAQVDDYKARQAKQYTQEAEYYQKKADSYRREADYYLKKAQGFQREAEYYTKRGDSDRAKDYMRRAERAMDDYNTQLRYARKADDQASDYLRRAANALRY